MKHTWPIYLSFLAAMQTNFINWTCWGTCYSRHKYVCVYSMSVCVYYMFWLWPHSLSAMWQFSRYLASSRSPCLSFSIFVSLSLFVYLCFSLCTFLRLYLCLILPGFRWLFSFFVFVIVFNSAALVVVVRCSRAQLVENFPALNIKVYRIKIDV